MMMMMMSKSNSSKSIVNSGNTAKKARRSSSECLDHIVAERKRRQEITQRFIALSATIPHLKKIDKVSILSEAIAYIKQLKEQGKKLEEESRKKNRTVVESVSLVNKRHDAACELVEARALEKQVLIRIHCHGHKAVPQVFSHLTNLDLSIVSTSVLPFGTCAIDITIVAQMGEKYRASMKDLVQSLRLAIPLC
ncbi:transcription factor bHLH18-like [Arachis duranensis]|uniref:Transcription factor bHLH18-like n=1 Tax=Arachis duranensis TaxID=130453 RepID=A0A6P4BPW1_ARADU|nr:transcription factor bHLH18-like [Arachis duranensis]